MRPCNAVLAVLGVASLAACGSGDSDSSCGTTRIASSPPTSATVGVQYAYVVDATYQCSFFAVCREVEGLQLPPGAVINSFTDSITWTPTAADANQDVPFLIATPKDFCGDRATQAWTVRVNPP
jgi:hypothetical protein